MSPIADFIRTLAARKISFYRLPRVWPAERQSIYEFLDTIPIDQALPRDAQTLPDEDVFCEDAMTGGGQRKLRWAAGALDGVSGHHVGSSREKDSAKAIFDAIAAVCHAPTHSQLKNLYAALLEGRALQSVDVLLPRIANSAIDPAHVFALAQWLTTKSPDRGPLKFGIAFSGLFTASPVAPLLSLARHDEFTLYAVVALSKIVGESERDITLWRIARLVHGWGRIQIVERLAATPNASIKA